MARGIFILVLLWHVCWNVSGVTHRPSISEPLEAPDEEFQHHTRTTKLKYGELEHTPLDNNYVRGSIWPKPQEEKREEIYYYVDNTNFEFTASGDGGQSQILKSAFSRYKKITFPKSHGGAASENVIQGLEVKVEMKQKNLDINMDESSGANLFKTIPRPEVFERSANNSAEQPEVRLKEPDFPMASASKIIAGPEPLGRARKPDLAIANLAKTIARPEISFQTSKNIVEQAEGRARDPDFAMTNASETITGPAPLGRPKTDLAVGNVSKSIMRQTLHNYSANDKFEQPFRQVPRGRARVPLLTGLDNNLDDNYVKGSIWPKPQFEYRQDFYYFVDSENFQFTTNSNGSFLGILESAFQRYRNIVFPKKSNEEMPYGVVLSNLDVVVESSLTNLDINMDERYELSVEAPKSTLTAKTVWGALRGLETFSQIVYLNKDNQYLARKTKVKDWPRFKHRAFLIDTSRHYLPIKTIYKFLDAMSYSKFNILHWHIVDDPAFPYVSKTFPELSLKGSRNTVTHVYTPANVQAIINYARNRGIRIIPEFDTPGHTESWKAIPGLLTDCGNGNFGPINPTKEENYKFLEKLFKEVKNVFPDKYVHLGADEVDFTCWKQNKEIGEWMKKNKNETYEQLEQYYAERLIKIVDGLQRNYIVWQDIFDNGVQLKDSTVINIWLGGWENEMKKVTEKGHKAILSACWYLNYINYGMDWPEFYFCDPQDFDGTDEQKNLVIGGTAAMWGEYVDATNILPRTWARGLAVGERLWSAKSVKNAKDAMERIWEHRCRYISRGIPAEPVVKGKFCIDEWDP